MGSFLSETYPIKPKPKVIGTINIGLSQIRNNRTLNSVTIVKLMEDMSLDFKFVSPLSVVCLFELLIKLGVYKFFLYIYPIIIIEFSNLHICYRC